MNNYCIDDISLAQLIEVTKGGTQAGIKNIIGIQIFVDKKIYFYSILDDCFFRGTIFMSGEILNHNEIYASIYDKDFGKKIIKRNLMRMEIDKQYITKEEIISGGFDLLSAYLSDLDYPKIKTTTDVDYTDLSKLEENLIISESQFEEVLNRPIMYDDFISNNKKKILK